MCLRKSAGIIWLCVSDWTVHQHNVVNTSQCHRHLDSLAHQHIDTSATQHFETSTPTNQHKVIRINSPPPLQLENRKIHTIQSRYVSPSQVHQQKMFVYLSDELPRNALQVFAFKNTSTHQPINVPTDLPIYTLIDTSTPPVMARLRIQIFFATGKHPCTNFVFCSKQTNKQTSHRSAQPSINTVFFELSEVQRLKSASKLFCWRVR